MVKSFFSASEKQKRIGENGKKKHHLQKQDLGENDSRKCCENACYTKMFFDNFVFALYISFKQTMFDMGLAFVRSGFLQKRLAAN